MSDEILREMCDKNYHQLLPLIAEKMQKEKEQKDKLNAVKARLIYGEESGIKIRSREESHYSESKTPTARTEPRRRHGNSPGCGKKGACLIGWEERSQYIPHGSDKSYSAKSPRLKRTEVETRRRQQKRTPSRATSQYSESEDSEGGHWKSKSRRQKSNTYEDDLYQPWTCEERNPFTPRIRHFSLPRTRMPSHVKTYDGSGDPEDHLKLFQYGRKNPEGWAITDKVSHVQLNPHRECQRKNYLQQTKHIKDPVEIHHIKQRDGESTEDFMERYKAEVLDVEGEVAALSQQAGGKHLHHGNRQEGGTNLISRKASKINKDRIANPGLPRSFSPRQQFLSTSEGGGEEVLYNIARKGSAKIRDQMDPATPPPYQDSAERPIGR
ncbi:hypothetical protein Tco_0375208 [Tanacetum coccineum]